MTHETKLILFFIWVVIAMTISTVGLVGIMRWYQREVRKVKDSRRNEEQKNHQ